MAAQGAQRPYNTCRFLILFENAFLCKLLGNLDSTKHYRIPSRLTPRSTEGLWRLGVSVARQPSQPRPPNDQFGGFGGWGVTVASQPSQTKPPNDQIGVNIELLCSGARHDGQASPAQPSQAQPSPAQPSPASARNCVERETLMECCGSGQGGQSGGRSSRLLVGVWRL